MAAFLARNKARLPEPSERTVAEEPAQDDEEDRMAAFLARNKARLPEPSEQAATEEPAQEDDDRMAAYLARNMAKQTGAGAVEALPALPLEAQPALPSPCNHDEQELPEPLPADEPDVDIADSFLKELDAKVELPGAEGDGSREVADEAEFFVFDEPAALPEEPDEFFIFSEPAAVNSSEAKIKVAQPQTL